MTRRLPITNDNYRGWGDGFRNAIKESLERIKHFPEAYSPISKRTRRCLVGKFPYGVIYKQAENEIVVVAVAHLHRKPEYWASRVR